jgi:hypothetical protein
MTQRERLDCRINRQREKNSFSSDLNICEQVFGNYRIGGSHHIFKTPWQGDPRINLQKEKGNFAKPYQVRQVLRALHKLKELEKIRKMNKQQKTS